MLKLTRSRETKRSAVFVLLLALTKQYVLLLSPFTFPGDEFTVQYTVKY